MNTVVLAPPSKHWLRALLIIRSVRTLVLIELSARRLNPPELCARFGVRFAGFDWPEQESEGLTWDVANRWWSVERVLRWWPIARDRPCLRRTIMLGHALRHLDPTFCLEVRSVTPFVAHAWLLVNGHRLDMGDAGPLLVHAGGGS